MNYQVICKQMFKLHISVYGTRNNDSFYITRFRANAKSMCISIYGARLWDSLNGNITSCTNIQAFKKCYKLDIIATY